MHANDPTVLDCPRTQQILLLLYLAFTEFFLSLAHESAEKFFPSTNDVRRTHAARAAVLLRTSANIVLCGENRVKWTAAAAVGGKEDETKYDDDVRLGPACSMACFVLIIIIRYVLYAFDRSNATTTTTTTTTIRRRAAVRCRV